MVTSKARDSPFKGSGSLFLMERGENMSKHQRLLEFTVDKQRLIRKKDSDFSHIVAGSKGYLRAKFHFESPEWSDCIKVARFWIAEGGQEYARKLDSNNSCDIPAEVLTDKKFLVAVIGKSNDMEIKTNKLKVKQEVS